MKNSRSNIRVFLSYICVLLLPVLLVGTMSIFVQRNVHLQKIADFESTTDYTAQLVETQLQDIISLSESILYDGSVQSFLLDNNSYKEASSQLYVWKNALTKFLQLNSNVDYIGVYSQKNNILLSNNSAVPLTDVFYAVTLGFTGFTRDEFQAFVQSQHFSGFYRLDSGIVMFLLTIANPITAGNLFMMQIDFDTIDRLLAQSLTGSDSLAFLMDAKGELLASTRHTQLSKTDIAEVALRFSEQQMGMDGYYHRTCQLSNGWHVVSLVSEGQIKESTASLTRLLLLIGIAVLIVGLVLALLMTRTNLKPIKRLISVLSMDASPRELHSADSFAYVEDSVNSLIERNRSYSHLNDEQRRLIDHALVRRLLLGEYHHVTQLSGLKEHTRLTFSDRAFAVISVLPEADTVITAYSQLTETLCDDTLQACLLDGRLIFLCFLDAKITAQDWWFQSHHIASRILDTQPDSLFVCISTLYSDPSQIHTAYGETQTFALTCGQRDGEAPLDRIIHYESIAPSVSELFYYYPPEKEVLLLKLIKSGDVLRAEDLLRDLRTENFNNRRISVFMAHHLVYDLCGTLIRGLCDIAAEEEPINLLLHACCHETAYDQLCDIILKICDCFHKINLRNDNATNSALEETIRAFVSEKYQDPNLTLDTLSEELCQPKYALYCFIRDHMNTTFFKMLEIHRIREACTLIGAGLSIKDVASKVGYGSGHTFRQAFKRVIHMVPSDYIHVHQQTLSDENKRDSSSLRDP